MFQGDINDLAAKVDALEANLMAQISALEDKTTKDVGAIVDGLKSALLPEVQAIRDSINAGVQSVNGTVVAVQQIVARIDGASVKLALAPIPVAETTINVTA